MILRGTLYKSIRQVGRYVLVKKRWQWLKAHASHCSAVTKKATKTQWMLTRSMPVVSDYTTSKNSTYFMYSFIPYFQWEIHSPNGTLALSSSHSPASASSTQASFPSNQSVSRMWILETSGSNLNLFVSMCTSVSVLVLHNPVVQIPLTRYIKPITAINYTATFRMCLIWPL